MFFSHRVALFAALTLSLTAASAQVNTTLLGQRSYANNLNDIWGYADGSTEYALVGLTNGTSIVDVTNPASTTQVAFIGGPNSTWRDIKTWGSYAYVVNETSGGMTIIDLSNLPSSAPSTAWTGGPLPGGGSINLSTAHNLFIDENGVGYIVGSNVGSGGAVMIDMAANPTNPPVLGVYNTNYCHDIYVRNDIMYTAEIYTGRFGIVDVSNKAAPAVIATQSTPNNFTHNVWLSDDANTLYTTDETNGAGVASFDISDPTDINFLDIVYSSKSGAVPHNTFVVGDFLVNSHYKDGVTIVDASNPANLVEIGSYDTSPLSGGGYDGCWGVYPYLPSGNILASDQQQGLFIIAANYAAATGISGTVTNATTGGPIFNATVSIAGVGSTNTDLFGQYSLSTPGPGTYDVTFGASGFTAETITGVSVSSGVLTLDEDLVPTSGGGACVSYCIAGGGTADEWIDAVSIGPLVNNSGDNNGYANFSSSFSPSYAAGSGYPIVLSPGFSGITYDEYWSIWIDYNQDGDFDDAGELAFDAGVASNDPVNGVLTIPASAPAGSTGMRVQMKFFSAGTTCGGFTYGEVEDYCITITGGGGGTCTAPSNPAVNALSATSVTVGWDAVAGALGYRVQGRKAGTSTFNGKNTPVNSVTVNVKANTTYEWQVQVQCADGSFSPYSALGSFTTPAAKTTATKPGLFPNPASSTVRVLGLPAQAPYRLVDALGRVVDQGQTSDATLLFDVSYLPAGHYTLHWQSSTGQGTERLVVVH